MTSNLCHLPTANFQISQQVLQQWAAQGPGEPLTVTLQVPAQQVQATVALSAPAEDPAQLSHYTLEVEKSRSSREKSGRLSGSDTGPAASRESPARSGTPQQQLPGDLQQFVGYLRTRTIHVHARQTQSCVPTTLQLQAAQRELK